jgi:hypothetical protein
MVLWGRPAYARGKRHHKANPACTDSFTSAMQAAQNDHLREAKKFLDACARASCGSTLRKQCKREGARLKRVIPSFVPAATDGAGASLVDVSVTVDGELLTSRLEGRAFYVNPGSHEITFKTAAGATATEKVVFARGEHRRPVSVTLGPASDAAKAKASSALPDVFETPPVAQAPAPRQAVAWEDPRPAKEPGGGSSVGPYLLGGLGLVGLGGYALVNYWARRDNIDLGECSPRCPVETVHHIRQLYLVADASAAVGIAALVGSATWFILRPGSSSKEVAVRRPGYKLDVRPTSSGGVALVSGAF